MTDGWHHRPSEKELLMLRGVYVESQNLLEMSDPEQGVSNAQRVIEEAERSLARHSREPQRKLRHLNRHRVAVHAEEAALGDATACLDGEIVDLAFRRHLR